MSASSAKNVFTLVRIEYGDPLEPVILNLTDGNEELITSKGIFTPDPLLDLAPVTITGTLDEPLRSLDLSYADSAFKDGITGGEAWPPVDITVWEMHRESSGDTFYGVFVGDVTRAIKNPKGREDIYTLKIAGEKFQTASKRSGLPMLELCDNTFGEEDTCKKDLSVLKETGTLTTITKQVVTITGLATQDPGYWQKGYVEFFGLRLRIIKWDTANDFTLAQTPPAEWNGSTVTVTPGCDNTLSVCAATWNNSSNFNGVGIAMPDYNPIIENPRGT